MLLLPGQHSRRTAYMKFLYKYPQAEYPYGRLIEENRARGGQGPEFELLDTGVFDQDRYFDIVIEYAKATPEDMAIRIEAFNRGPDAAGLHIAASFVVPQHLGLGRRRGRPADDLAGVRKPGRPVLVTDDTGVATLATVPVVYRLGRRTLDAPPGGQFLFTDNETNGSRDFGGRRTA